LDHIKKKLIEELILIGHLIDPAPGAGKIESKDSAECLSPSIAEKPSVGSSELELDLETLPLSDDIDDLTYATKDMFAASVDSHVTDAAELSQTKQPAAKKYSSSNAQISDRVIPATTEQLEQNINEIRFPVEELARELVTLIADYVSQRSGEQLDDTFRDELTKAVTERLEDWLK
jgi:hypothetical protein